ncbi:MAG: CorA family divalent cation transporter, partial [bacterium]
MHLRYVTSNGVETGQPDDLASWRLRRDGYLWLDLPACDDAAAELLADFGFDHSSIQACRQRSHLPAYHRTRDYWFVLTHRPLIGRAGHVHLLQLEQFIREDALITLHGPHNPDVDHAELGRETQDLRRRLDSGELLPKSPSGLSHVLMSSLAREISTVLSGIASRIAVLEQQVMV